MRGRRIQSPSVPRAVEYESYLSSSYLIASPPRYRVNGSRQGAPPFRPNDRPSQAGLGRSSHRVAERALAERALFERALPGVLCDRADEGIGRVQGDFRVLKR